MSEDNSTASDYVNALSEALLARKEERERNAAAQHSRDQLKGLILAALKALPDAAALPETLPPAVPFPHKEQARVAEAMRIRGEENERANAKDNRSRKLRRAVVVYGKAGESLVFIPKRQAAELAKVWGALGASTWADLRSRMPRKRLKELLQLLGDRVDFDTFYKEQRQGDRKLTKAKAMAAFRALPLGERIGLDDEPFDGFEISAVCDGLWPDWPQQQMLEWLSEDLPHATAQSSMHNGPFLELDPAHEQEIVAAVEALGFRCLKEEGLVRQACGY